MSKVITMQDIKNGKMQSIEWDKEAERKDGTTYPQKVWQNLECILKKHNIILRYNLVSKEIESNLPSKSRRGLLTQIYTLNVTEGLNMGREETFECMYFIAEENSYNPFVEIIEENENQNYTIIYDVFKCMYINDDDLDNHDYYFTLFTKWCLNLVKMAHNTEENEYRLEGVLVLQGKQGCRKTTFVNRLMPFKKLYKGDKSLNPENTDSVIENTKYVLVEWGELDHTLKGEQSKLKQFITTSIDEYRSPYGRFSEKHPRVTSYAGTVNKRDFLKDETGSRRFWIIPVKGFDFPKLESIDKKEFWGAVYSLWKGGTIKDYLEKDEMDKLNEMNFQHNFQTDASYIIDEKIKWDMPKEEWDVYGITEISNYLCFKETKSLKIELEKRGFKYGAHRTKAGKVKKGFKIPRFEVSLNI